MEKQTLGKMIAALRKERAMTQLQLAEKMGVTDKAVSKWERDLSCPDIQTLPHLAELFGISLDQLLQVRQAEHTGKRETMGQVIDLICRILPLAMGVAVIVLSLLQELDFYSACTLLGIGLTAVGFHFLKDTV